MLNFYEDPILSIRAYLTIFNIFNSLPMNSQNNGGMLGDTLQGNERINDQVIAI